MSATILLPTEAPMPNAKPQFQPAEQGIGVNTETQSQMETGFQKTQDTAEQVRQNWEKRDREQGTDYWVCPLCTVANRVRFGTIGECQTHIDTIHGADVENLKSANEPNYKYIPKAQHESPKRTIEDFLPPDQADKLRRFTVPSNGHRVVVQDRRQDQSAFINPHQLIAMIEVRAIEAVARLRPADLQAALEIASAHSKWDLKKAISKRIAEVQYAPPAPDPNTTKGQILAAQQNTVPTPEPVVPAVQQPVPPAAPVEPVAPVVPVKKRKAKKSPKKVAPKKSGKKAGKAKKVVKKTTKKRARGR